MNSAEHPVTRFDLPRFGKTDLQQLGRYLRARRTATGLTLRRLSELSEVSVASLRALEAARSSPSLISVLNVADALGLTIDEAIQGALTTGKRVVVTRAASGPDIELTQGLNDPALEARIITLNPGELLTVPANLRDAPSLCVVLEGVLIASRNKSKREKLVRGDAYHARPDLIMSWANAGANAVRLLFVADRRGTAGASETWRKT